MRTYFLDQRVDLPVTLRSEVYSRNLWCTSAFSEAPYAEAIPPQDSLLSIFPLPKECVGLSCHKDKEAHVHFLNVGSGTSLVIHWLRLYASNAGGAVSVPGPGTKIPPAGELNK